MKEGKHFQCIMLFYFKKGKNATKMQKKDLCSVWRRCCDWSNMSKVVCKVCAGEFLSLDNVPWSGRPVEVDSDQIETLIENNQHYTMWAYHMLDILNQHIQNIQINKVNGENEKCVFYSMENTKQTFWATQ